ncbi:hypothetical protein [Actinomyces sp. S4-C9]|uniref:hypothetical protein n=2 Tax=unclassified Actinomyces TaxID=2609248 RepID=UPI00051003AC|nr:hypothetical protein [Actinomyces sp. S4-C9]KGF00943.1 hypothetical protein HMPREF1628_06995 [Actinomyces sp. S4-C9]
MRAFSIRARFLSGLVAALMLSGLAACSSAPNGSSESASELTEATQPAAPTETVAFDTDVEVSKALFDQAEAAVVASPEPVAQARAAAVAGALSIPMLTEVSASDVGAELTRLGVKTVLAVGAVDVVADVDVMTDAGDVQALSTVLGSEVSVSDEFGVDDLLSLDPSNVAVPEFESQLAPEDVTELPAQTEQTGGEEGNVEATPTSRMVELAALPHGERGKANPNAVGFATQDSPLGVVANALTAGLDVSVLAQADPRATSESMKMMREGRVAVGLGPDFGGTQMLVQTAQLATSADELPGGGGLVFPGRRMVALYGHPKLAALGLLGEQSPTEAAQLALQYAQQYLPFSDVQVIPAFEIIATVASAGAGDDGLYSDVTPAADLDPSVDAITEVGGYAIIDLQPGHAKLLDQAKLYAELLKRPNVGLALDPEWKLYGDQVHLQQVGHVEIAEVNEVSQWLAELVRDNNLPQKVFMLHQFQLQMIRDRDQMVHHPELATVVHVDGHGSPEAKMHTWDVIREDMQPWVWMAWKNFIDEDKPMLNAEQTMGIEPRPWFVSFQ